MGFYTVLFEDSVNLGYDVWSLANLLPKIRRYVMYLFSKAYSSEKGTNFTPPRTDYLSTPRQIPEYGMLFHHPSFTFLFLKSQCSPEHSYNKTNEMHLILKFIFGIELYRFRTGFLSIIRSLVLYTPQ